MRHLFTLVALFGVVMLAGGIGVAEPDYPITFQSGYFDIPTLDQLDTRVRSLHPDLKINKKFLDERVEYKKQSFNALEIRSEGVESGLKIIQKLTYLEMVPDLWRLVYVDNRLCNKGTALNSEKEWVEKWMCSEEPFPIKGFSDLYIVSHENVDLEVIQKAFKDPVVPYVKPTPKNKEVKLMSLGDLKLYLDQLGTSMKVAPTIYQAPGKTNEKVDGFIFTLAGKIDSIYRVEQTFTYIVEDQFLKLKEIDGIICRFAKTLKKEICDPIYVPSPATPLPLKLLNHWEVTGVSPEVAEKSTKNIPSSRQCGSLQGHFETILKVHFARSIFDANNPIEHKRYLQNIVHVADPMGILLSKKEKKEVWNRLSRRADFEESLVLLTEEFKKGKYGDCKALANYIVSLKGQLEERVGELSRVLIELEKSEFDYQKLGESSLDWSEFQKSFIAKIPKMIDGKMFAHSPVQAMDIFAGKIRNYLREVLNQVSDLEKLTVAAMAKQDAYSVMLNHTDEVNASLNGVAERKYFGVSVETGMSGRHYLSRVHRLAGLQGLKYGDEILKINEEVAQELTYKRIDKILLDVEEPIQLVLNQNGVEVSMLLNAQIINPLEFYYSVSRVEVEEKVLLNIQLKSFEAGVVAQIKEKVQDILDQQRVDGFVLDLRGNPGGNTDEAINLMSLFVRDRIVSYSRLGSRNVSPLKSYQAKEEFFVDDQLPLAVLVDHKSMSSSEIVASGLKSLGRSITLGSKTHGKLVGQFYIPLTLSSQQPVGLLLTSFEFYNVDGQALNGKGIVPDIKLENSDKPIFDDGIGFGRDILLKDLQPVEKYQFQVEDISQWRFGF